MKNKNNISADIGLAVEQFPELNKKFYTNYFSDFYSIKLDVLLSIISRTSEYKKSIDNLDVDFGGMKCNLGEHEESDLLKYAKIELMSSYYHCLETFIRLFIVHALCKPCPWIELSKLNIKQYRDYLKKLSEGSFDIFNNSLNSDNTVLYVLTGFKETPKGMEKDNIEVFKSWIQWAANELLNNFEYNTFKHGMALYTSESGLALKSEEKEIFNKKKSECLEMISKVEHEDRFIWALETIYISYDMNAALIFVIQNLIYNILNVGRYFYAKGKYKSGYLPDSKCTPDFFHKSKNEDFPGIPATITGFKIGLLYYESKDV